MGNNTPTLLGPTQMRRKPKIMIHEHLDCSLRPRTMIELWDKIGFEKAEIPFPANVVSPWNTAKKKSGNARRILRKKAVTNYQKFLVSFASESLANYVKAIVDHILPLMQSVENLKRITRERIHDAKVDGIIGMELRFAPQLHTAGGLSLEEVMDAVCEEVDNSPFPMKLIVCALRHEDAEMAKRLADLTIEYRDHVGVFDLAADEELNPGVLDWWLPEALRVREETDGETLLTIHLTETRKATARDKRLIAENGINRIGHGIQDEWTQVREVCPTSNVVTGQVESIDQHPIDQFYRAGDPVTVNTDGTLFTEVQLSDEYRKLQEAFGWTDADFLAVNLTALECSSFSSAVKDELRASLEQGYGS